MTSLAFGFGVLPLALSSDSGAGASGRIAIGTIVLDGVLTAMAFSLLFSLAFYVVVRTLTGKRKAAPVSANEAAE